MTFEVDELRRKLDSFEEPTVGRALYVGGFILADPFDTFLRRISEGYLQTAWHRLHELLSVYEISVPDLTWGWMHGGETDYGELKRVHDGGTPLDFMGWTSTYLQDYNREHSETLRMLNAELMRESPTLCFAATWRSRKWRIAPDDFEKALFLIQALCTDELTDWNPDCIDIENAITEPWRMIAAALLKDDQLSLDFAIDAAREEYTDLGYRITMRGFKSFVDPGIMSPCPRFTISIPNA